MNSILGTIIVEEKKISWDDSIEKVLGKSFSDIHADYRNVTLRQLCERRGGTPSGPISTNATKKLALKKIAPGLSANFSNSAPHHLISSHGKISPYTPGSLPSITVAPQALA